VAVPRLLWRVVEQATLDTLRGRSRGQFHIALARPAGIEDFFLGLAQIPKNLQGYAVTVPIEATPGPPAVPAMSLAVVFNGWQARRKEWRIPSQRPATAYPLWRPGVGPQPNTPLGTDVIVLVRDEHDRFHARWLTGAQRGQLPTPVEQAVAGSDTGTRALSAAELAAIRTVAGIPSSPPPGPPAPLPPPPPAPPSLGTPYQPVSPPPRRQGSPVPFSVDPDVIDRGTKAHIDTQNALAARLVSAGLLPLEPQASTPPYDLAWDDQQTLFVAEVKSLTPANEEKQLRLGLGQILRYTHELRSNGVDSVQPVLVAEREPGDPTWRGTCSELGVILTWPARFGQSLRI
jgi:hypothetical protein